VKEQGISLRWMDDTTLFALIGLIPGLRVVSIEESAELRKFARPSDTLFSEVGQLRCGVQIKEKLTPVVSQMAEKATASSKEAMTRMGLLVGNQNGAERELEIPGRPAGSNIKKEPVELKIPWRDLDLSGEVETQ